MKHVNKILVAVDGSDQALQTVRYLSGILSPKQTRIVLFHVGLDSPEFFQDMRDMPVLSSRMAEINSWMIQIKRKIDDFMYQAKKILIDAGFSSDAVVVKVQTKKKGVARDILIESLKNYSAVALGRKGVSKLKDVLMGSIASKLVGKLVHIPVIVVGGSPNPRKIIIAFDGSEGAFKTLDSIGSLVNTTNCEVEICHVIRPMSRQIPLVFSADVETDWLKQNIEEIKPEMVAAQNQLIKSGFSQDKVSRKILTDKPSRALGIVGEAAAGGYGTIAVGRRGMTIVEEFTIGRVGRKILHAAENFAIWVVS